MLRAQNRKQSKKSTASTNRVKRTTAGTNASRDHQLEAIYLPEREATIVQFQQIATPYKKTSLMACRHHQFSDTSTLIQQPKVFTLRSIRLRQQLRIPLPCFFYDLSSGFKAGSTITVGLKSLDNMGNYRPSIASQH